MNQKRYWLRGGVMGAVAYGLVYLLSLVYLGCSGDVYYLCPIDFVQEYLDNNFPIRHGFFIQEPIIFLIIFVVLGSVAGGIYGKIKNKKLEPSA
ncbi:MAG: hypothetical protein Q7S34_03320 [bacterium]|nr:hypothetical protein [bacterium]